MGRVWGGEGGEGRGGKGVISHGQRPRSISKSDEITNYPSFRNDNQNNQCFLIQNRASSGSPTYHRGRGIACVCVCVCVFTEKNAIKNLPPFHNVINTHHPLLPKKVFEDPHHM